MYVEEPDITKKLTEIEQTVKDTTRLQQGALSVFIIFFPIWVVSTVLSQWLG
jgi:hypothetical protein